MDFVEAFRELSSGLVYDDDGFIKPGSIDPDIYLKMNKEEQQTIYEYIQTAIRPFEFIDV